MAGNHCDARAFSLVCVAFSWDDSRRAFADAAQWFVGVTAVVGDRWGQPGLGEWDVRALVGHTSRAFLTVLVACVFAADGVVVGKGQPAAGEERGQDTLGVWGALDTDEGQQLAGCECRVGEQSLAALA